MYSLPLTVSSSRSITEDHCYVWRERKSRSIDLSALTLDRELTFPLLSQYVSVLIILPLNWGGTSFPWVSGPVLGCLISGIFTFVLFVLWEGRFAKIPVVPRMSLRQCLHSCIVKLTSTSRKHSVHLPSANCFDNFPQYFFFVSALAVSYIYIN